MNAIRSSSEDHSDLANANRIEAIQRKLVMSGLDGFVHYQSSRAKENVTIPYLTGVRGLEDSGVIIPASSEPVLLVKDFEESRAKRQSSLADVRGVTTLPVERAMASIGEVFKEKGLAGKRIGIDESELTVEVYNKLLSLGVTMVPFATELISMRMVKTAAEAKKIREAAEIAGAAIEKVRSLVSEGLEERELAAEASNLMQRSGEASFVSVQFGPNASFPHHRGDSTRVRGDGLLVVDLGANVEGYNSDITRTLYVGSPSERHRKIPDSIKLAVSDAIEKVRPGVPVKEVALAARRVIRNSGLPQPRHRIGHGIGLNVHEKPIVEEGFEYVLQAGNVIAIEPGTYLDGDTGCRIEVDLLVTESGAELLDPKSLPLL